MAANNAVLSLLLVDYENVQKLDLAALPAGMRVRIFVGSSQKNVPFDLVRAAQALGDRLEWVKSDSVGPNALDFMLAFSLGQELARAPETACTILSKDQGFDPLLKHIQASGGKCLRVNSQMELVPGKPTPEQPDLKRVIDALRKSAKQSRPRKRKTLAASIASMLKKQATDREVEELIDLMFRDGLVSEAAGVISYQF